MAEYNTKDWDLKIRLAQLGLTVDRKVLAALQEEREHNEVAFQLGLEPETVSAVYAGRLRIRMGHFQ